MIWSDSLDEYQYIGESLSFLRLVNQVTRPKKFYFFGVVYEIQTFD